MGSHCTLKILICIICVSFCIQWLQVFAVDVSSGAGRKLLRDEIKEEEATPPAAHLQKDQNGYHYSKLMAMAAPGVLILGCVLMWPCCNPKKKDIHSADSHRDLTAMDLSSSFEANPENVTASPWRHAPPSPSPSRFPPSSPNPSRHPLPSPRYAMSPRLDRFGSVHLNFSQIVKATHSFSSSFKIGEGGFGTVYKAQLPGGQWIAVKRAKKEHFDSAEFNSEVEILSKIEHRCLVRLLGYVDKGNERLIVTEYVSNGTLREHLDGVRDRILDFKQRLEVAIDIAHGLAYLHLYSEKQIIHRDVKSSNILLNENLKAKVADFGFARVGPAEGEQTHISTKVKGTVGYLDPEYMKTYQLTPKSDVYSYGVLLIEILTGRRPVEPKRPIEERVTIRWAFFNYNEGDVLRLVDPLMNERVDVEILKKIFCLAFQCAAPGKADRPDMKSVGEQLWAMRMEYQRSRRG
ncbi:calmodulin-binding receptor-like cytoplasmic kinase 3 [Chenopodium quinoa]|uniref:non-specific serine/threonine protein kinase n=1 Tax=Chenopodium quinoa TaxID=63459 RepID=A0A803LH46_CHEQI|nr:calmodulin-binding receptor-like cytoplasmic kinase 3 [Chenopodium quinoa]